MLDKVLDLPGRQHFNYPFPCEFLFRFLKFYGRKLEPDVPSSLR